MTDHKDARQLLADFKMGAEYGFGVPYKYWIKSSCGPDTMQAIAGLVAEQDRRIAEIEAERQWQPINTLRPFDGLIVMGWGEYRERDGFSPAFMRWYDSVNHWTVSGMPFYPTHWMPLPASPQEGTRS